jgi:hypothetical protein
LAGELLHIKKETAHDQRFTGSVPKETSRRTRNYRRPQTQFVGINTDENWLRENNYLAGDETRAFGPAIGEH